MLSDETRYQLLKKLQERPDMSQRALARELGVSLGKVNYCLRALVGKGWVKAVNFQRSPNKRAYLYQLTPKGFEAKGRLTLQFLKVKRRQYERLEQELAALQREAEQNAPPSGPAEYKSGGQ